MFSLKPTFSMQIFKAPPSLELSQVVEQLLKTVNGLEYWEVSGQPEVADGLHQINLVRKTIFGDHNVRVGLVTSLTGEVKNQVYFAITCTSSLSDFGQFKMIIYELYFSLSWTPKPYNLNLQLTSPAKYKQLLLDVLKHPGGVETKANRFVGSDLIEWVMAHANKNREEAVDICTELFAEKIFYNIKGERLFTDKSYYNFRMTSHSVEQLKTIDKRIREMEEIEGQVRVEFGLLTRDDPALSLLLNAPTETFNHTLASLSSLVSTSLQDVLVNDPKKEKESKDGRSIRESLFGRVGRPKKDDDEKDTTPATKTSNARAKLKSSTGDQEDTRKASAGKSLGNSRKGKKTDAGKEGDRSPLVSSKSVKLAESDSGERKLPLAESTDKKMTDSGEKKETKPSKRDERLADYLKSQSAKGQHNLPGFLANLPASAFNDVKNERTRMQLQKENEKVEELKKQVATLQRKMEKEMAERQKAEDVLKMLRQERNYAKLESILGDGVIPAAAGSGGGGSPRSLLTTPTTITTTFATSKSSPGGGSDPKINLSVTSSPVHRRAISLSSQRQQDGTPKPAALPTSATQEDMLQKLREKIVAANPTSSSPTVDKRTTDTSPSSSQTVLGGSGQLPTNQSNDTEQWIMQEMRRRTMGLTKSRELNITNASPDTTGPRKVSLISRTISDPHIQDDLALKKADAYHADSSSESDSDTSSCDDDSGAEYGEESGGESVRQVSYERLDSIEEKAKYLLEEYEGLLKKNFELDLKIGENKIRTRILQNYLSQEVRTNKFLQKDEANTQYATPPAMSTGQLQTKPQAIPATLSEYETSTGIDEAIRTTQPQPQPPHIRFDSKLSEYTDGAALNDSGNKEQQPPPQQPPQLLRHDSKLSEYTDGSALDDSGNKEQQPPPQPQPTLMRRDSKLSEYTDGSGFGETQQSQQPPPSLPRYDSKLSEYTDGSSLGENGGSGPKNGTPRQDPPPALIRRQSVFADYMSAETPIEQPNNKTLTSPKSTGITDSDESSSSSEESESDADSDSDPERQGEAAAESEDEVPLCRIIDYGELVMEYPPIGSGAFGIVSRATWRGSTVAVKQLLVHLDTKQYMEFVHEAEIMERVSNHPNIAFLYGVTSANIRATSSHFCIVGEYYENGSVADYLRNNPRVKWVDIVYMARCAAAGVMHLHKENIIHRDLAARNLLLDGKLAVHVADFGLARIKRQTYAQTNGNLGSIKWLAPEAITQQYSESSDVYSFGVVLWELLTRGKEPYPGEEILAIALAVTREKRRPPIPPDCPPVWRDLMQRCWAHEPMDRPTFEEIWQVLDKYWKSLKQEANAEGSKVIRGSKHRHKKHSHSKQSRASPKGSKATQKKTKD